ncbi:MAG TPA: hypothetical protein VEZ40_03305, partial [Pyrinomonadaceae bacterium]|nr:hypothetical protein [Pyrinomonadaceae bacterium]
MWVLICPCPAAALSPLEFRLAFFEEGSDALVLVFAGEAEGEEIDLAAQAFVERRALGGLDGLLRHAQG